MSKSDLRIEVLGTEITISADEETDYLNTLLERYKQTIENVRQMSGLKDPLKIAVLTGFLLCDDLEKADTGKTASGGEAEQLTLGMILRLDEALKASQHLPVTVKEAEPREKTASFYRLIHTIKNYSWGSPEWLPEFLGQKNLSRIPWAELWLGVNPLGPSRIKDQRAKPLSADAGNGEKNLLLSELIARLQESSSEKGSSRNQGNLPFLLKLLAVAKPLSIQAHPNSEQAREGFESEEKAGIPRDAPGRTYRDSNQKEEILCALSPFTTLCGFRNPSEIHRLLSVLLDFSEKKSTASLKEDIEYLIYTLESGYSISNFLSALYSLPEETILDMGLLIRTGQDRLEEFYPEFKSEWDLCSYLSGLFPDDSGILAPLYLNVLELVPGEAVYIPAGIIHAHINGTAIELCSDSDNVLRGGLTTKHKDYSKLFGILDFSEFQPEIMRPTELNPLWHSYTGGELILSVMHGKGNPVPYGESCASILIVTQGDAAIKAGGEEATLSRGESVFIPEGQNRNIIFSGNFTAYAAAGKEHNPGGLAL